jgi:hypothetical protein
MQETVVKRAHELTVYGSSRRRSCDGSQLRECTKERRPRLCVRFPNEAVSNSKICTVTVVVALQFH